MIKLLFVCHGNICRSPMAEYVMKYLINEYGLQNEVYVTSGATSTEALGCNIYSAARRELEKHNIPFGKHSAKQISAIDYYKYDYIIVMDELNYYNTLKIFKEKDEENKLVKLLDFTEIGGEIADPWYTGNFSEAYNQIFIGCDTLAKSIKDAVSRGTHVVKKFGNKELLSSIKIKK